MKNKVNFALNNLSESNIEKHSGDIKVFCESETFVHWFAKNLVLRRSTQESDANIQLYLQLAERVNKPVLFVCIVRESLLLL